MSAKITESTSGNRLHLFRFPKENVMKNPMTLSLAALLGGLLAMPAAHAFDMGRMMNPSKWMGGGNNNNDDDRNNNSQQGYGPQSGYPPQQGYNHPQGYPAPAQGYGAPPQGYYGQPQGYGYAPPPGNNAGYPPAQAPAPATAPAPAPAPTQNNAAGYAPAPAPAPVPGGYAPTPPPVPAADSTAAEIQQLKARIRALEAAAEQR
jgi:hypothetical protein